MRLLLKLAYREEFEGDTERRTAAYINIREDSSTGPTYKLTLEVEFQKKPIKFFDYSLICISLSYYKHP
ncbi:MAG: palindromic element RPE1 domain-containing protein [Rickettsia endosymbiont of Glossina mortisans submortisans]|nr:palindromic element RPE1 domain-containing protein [Rickettsia endosymbiont of Glossina mortisans submortisans]